MKKILALFFLITFFSTNLAQANVVTKLFNLNPFKKCKLQYGKTYHCEKIKVQIKDADLPPRLQGKINKNQRKLIYDFKGEMEKINGSLIPNGKGRFDFFPERFDGVLFMEGDYVNGVMTGKGKIAYSNGTIIEGDFKDNEVEGFAKIKYSDGTFYEGQVKRGGIRHGKGTYKWLDGKISTSEWVNGKQVGFGETIKNKKKTKTIFYSKLIKKGQSCFQKKDYNCAIKIFKEAEKSDLAFERSWAREHLFMSYSSLKKDEEAFPYLVKNLDSQIPEHKKFASVMLSIVMTKMGELADGKIGIKALQQANKILIKENGPEITKKFTYAENQLQLAKIYQYGLDVKQNKRKAFEIVKTIENPIGYLHLGYMYMLGVGTEASYANASKYFKLAQKTHYMNRKSSIGIRFGAFTPELIKEHNIKKNLKGAFIESVIKNSAADKGGLKINDILLQANKRNIEYTKDILLITENKKPGEIVQFKILRNKSILYKNIKLDKSNKELTTFFKDAKIYLEFLEEKKRVPVDYLEMSNWLESTFVNNPLKIYLLANMFRDFDSIQTYVWTKISLNLRKDIFKNTNVETPRGNSSKNILTLLEKKFLSKDELKRANQIVKRKQQYVLAKIKNPNQPNQYAVTKKTMVTRSIVREDKLPPIINIKENFKFNSPEYLIKGNIKDKDSAVMTVHFNGKPIKIDRRGNFSIKRFSPGGEKISIVAWDEWANKSEKTITIQVEEEKEVLVQRKLEPLKPSIRSRESGNDKIAIVIGIEKYLSTGKATFANKDATYFNQYLKNTFRIRSSNIKVLLDKDANLIGTYGALSKWLKSVNGSGGKEIFVFFAGHGLSSNDGKELFLLAHDSDPDLLKRTALLRSDLFQILSKLNAKSVNIFFDTCYSGPSRDGNMLIANARPIRVTVKEDQSLPKNFNLFSAAQNDEISSSLPSINHGIFSYYLMKGLEGNADLNRDRKITNGEMLTYLQNNVSQQASTQNRKQTPSFLGNSENILLNY